jgi:hypothetical protein
MKRACDQLNTHGMARRSSILRLAVRLAGRLPMFRPTISPIGVADQKKSSNAGSSYTRARKPWNDASARAVMAASTLGSGR